MPDQVKNTKKRYFKYGGQIGPVDDDLTLEDVKSQMVHFFPELSEPKIETVKKDDTTTYVFSKQAGRKGADHWCKVCGEFMMFPDSHRCPPRWEFCLEDDGDDWRNIYAQYVGYLYGGQKRQTRVIEPEEAEESEA